MNWREVRRAPLGAGKSQTQTRDDDDKLWVRCDSCQDILYRKDFEKNLNVCEKCGHHHPIDPISRLDALMDEGYQLNKSALWSSNPLDFTDTKPYAERLEKLQRKLGDQEALIVAHGHICGVETHVAVFDYRFMGGSMGAVVGEKLAQMFLKAARLKQPAVVFSSSGGARMQEGIVSLLQMAKVCVALDQMKSTGVPMI